jgi:AP-1 complex subunit mu
LSLFYSEVGCVCLLHYKTMVASALFIMDTKGKVIISRNYRGDVPLSVADRFAQHIQEKEEMELRPVFTIDGITYLYIKCNNVLLMAVTKRNSNVTLILFFLYRLTILFKDYFGELEEESIRDNFVVVYELLDETMDNGYPQTCESKILREVITQESNKMEVAPRPPVALTNAVSWRTEGIKHRKNEIFLDVIEKLNLLVSNNGTVLHSEIIGSVQMKSFLSGMPELKLGLNDKLMFEATGRANNKVKAVELEDIKFHQCVRLARFDNDRTISFIPPDGEFELMSYR